MPQTPRLIDELNDLHAEYVELVNGAIAENDEARAHELAEAYDTDAIALIAERENLTHLLPLRRRGDATPDTPLRRLARRVKLAA